MSAPIHASGRRNPFLLAMLAAAPVVAAAVLGNTATAPNIEGWYAGLAKPALNPPNWAFGPVWTVLYILMAYAFLRILRLPIHREGRTEAIIAFLAQIALNGAWSFVFFAAHSPISGLIVILALEAAILVTIVLFMRLDRIASYCLWPYAAWVAFAIYLNASIWLLNR